MANLAAQCIVKDLGNSSTAPLLAGAAFVGAARNIRPFSQIHITVFMAPATVQASMFVEFSPNGTDWDISIPVVVRSGDVFIPQTLIFVTQFFRVRLINDGGAAALPLLKFAQDLAITPVDQTALRLNSELLLTGTKELGRTLDQGPSGSDPVSYVRNFNTGRDPQREFVEQGYNSGGAAFVANFEFEVAQDNIPKNDSLEVTGLNPTVNSSGGSQAPADVTNIQGLYPGQPDGFTPEAVRIASSDVNDTVSGTGCQRVRFKGLKTALSTAYEEEEQDTNGTTLVVTVSTWYRIIMIKGVRYGSGGTNAGDITVGANVTTAVVFAQIDIGFGESKNAAFTVPAGKTGWILGVFNNLVRSGGNIGSGQMSIRLRELLQGGYNATRSYFIQTGGPSKPNVLFPIEVPEGADVTSRVESVSDNGSQFTSEMDVLLVDNPPPP